MKAKDLIKILEKHPDREIILSKDAEGNGFKECNDFFIGAYKDGEIGLEGLTVAHKRQGYTDEDVMQGGIAAIVLYP